MKEHDGTLSEEEFEAWFLAVLKDKGGDELKDRISNQPIGLVEGTTGTYHIGNGIYGGEGFWEMFNNILKKEANKFLSK